MEWTRLRSRDGPDRAPQWDQPRRSPDTPDRLDLFGPGTQEALYGGEL